MYDVLVEATVEKMGSWRRVTPEDVVTVSRERTIMDTYHQVSSDLSNNSQLPDTMASVMNNTSLYDTVINTVADIHMMVSCKPFSNNTTTKFIFDIFNLTLYPRKQRMY